MTFLLQTIGELLNEQNLWAVLLIGGTLSVVNVVSTSVGLDRAQHPNKSRNNFSPSVKFSGVVVDHGSNYGDRGTDEKRRGRERETGRERIRSRSRRDGSKRETSKRRKSRDAQRDELPVSRLPPDAVVINLDDSEVERACVDVLDDEDEMAERRHDDYKERRGRRGHSKQREEVHWDQGTPHMHMRLRKRERHRTSEGGVSQRGILKRWTGRDGKARDGSKRRVGKSKRGGTDTKGEHYAKKKRRHKSERYEGARERSRHRVVQI